MPPRRKVSERQLEILVEFAERNRDIALGRFTGGPLGNQSNRLAWDEVASKLNAVATGSTKTSDQWRRYWIELKAKTKTKAADSRRNAAATGGGPNKLVPLSAIEERVLAIIGPVAVEGLPGVRLPIDIPIDGEANAQTSSTQEASIDAEMEVEWLDIFESPPEITSQPHTSSTSLQSPPPVDTPTNTAATLQGEIVIEPTRNSLTEDRTQSTQSQRSGSTRPSQRPRMQRLSNVSTRRDDRVPRWAHDMEMRRIAAEERHADALEAMVGLIRDIRDDLRSYLRNNNNK